MNLCIEEYSPPVELLCYVEEDFEATLRKKVAISLFVLYEKTAALISNLCKEFSIESQVAFIEFLKSRELSVEHSVIPFFIAKLQEVANAEADLSKKELMENVISRYEQIENSVPVHRLTPSEKLHLAYFIEINVCKNAHKTDSLAHNTFGIRESKLARPIALEKGGIHIENLYPLGKGGSKYVNASLVLPLLRTAHDSYLVSTAVIDKLKRDSAAFNKANTEALLYTQIRDLPGIWPLLFCTERRLSETISEIRITTVLASGTLSSLRPFTNITLSDEISISRGILLGLQSLHTRMYAHRDIKASNILFKITDDGRYEIGLTDFGHVISLCANNIFKSYGTRSYSAPELLTPSTQIDYCKCDMWAAGKILYEIHFKQSLSCHRIISYLLQQDCIQDNDKLVLYQTVHQEIEEPLTVLKEKKPPTQAESYERLIYEMLRLSLFERNETQQALEIHNTL